MLGEPKKYRSNGGTRASLGSRGLNGNRGMGTGYPSSGQGQRTNCSTTSGRATSRGNCRRRRRRCRRNSGCVICMMDFVYGDAISCLPCLHAYHVNCIDDWLSYSLSCPCCMEPVDPSLLYPCVTC